MTKAVFKSYENGYFTFLFDNGENMVFDEVHPKALHQFDLINDPSFQEKTFWLTFSEVFDSNDDLVIYRVESLKLV